MKDRSKIALWGACIWGLMEALWFFLVPDIWLSLIAVRGRVRTVAWATGLVVVGAMGGACILYWVLSDTSYAGFHNFWSAFPGFKPKMIEVVRQHLAGDGAQGLIRGPNSGIPYRVYVLEAWKSGIGLVPLLLWTPIARLERIIIAPIAVLALRWGLARSLGKRVSEAWRERFLFVLLTLYWIGLYIWYWGTLLPKLY